VRGVHTTGLLVFVSRSEEAYESKQGLQPLFAKALPEVEKKRNNNAALKRVRFESYHEGLSAQIMHHGSYAEEAPTIAQLHEYITQGGNRPRGKHHEIYLNDPRKTQPAKLLTVIRQPFK